MQKFKCIICECDIEALYFEAITSEHPEQGSWDGGVVEVIYMPYGSKLDGSVFVFGICDKCIEEKYKKGLIGKRLNDYL
jgi:hypothetical protein